jgi:hypothetical protein
MFGPRKPTLAIFILRLLGSLAGGMVGALAIFGIYILGISISPAEGEVPQALFLTIALVFVGSLTTNLVTIFVLSFLDREIYPRYLTILTQSFLLQLVLFVFSIPIYLIISKLNLGEIYINYIAALHLLLSVQVSSLLLEVLSISVYKIVAVYGIALGSIFSIGVVVLVYLLGLELFLLFILPPLCWVSIELFRALAEIVYYNFYKFYGIDVLSEETKLEE